MSRPLRVLDLFSGIGGFALGLERAGMKVVGFCEIDRYARAVLAKHWPSVPCHDDITTRDFAKGEADVVCGGFPCQDISTAGLGAGLAGERSGLWRHLLRAIRVVRPLYAVVENVAALLSRGMGTVLGDLAEIGYDAEWHCIPASAVGAPHRRDRVWIVTHPGGKQHEGDCSPLSGSLSAQLSASYADSDVHSRSMADGEDCRAAEGSENGNACEGKTPNGKRLWLEPSASGTTLADADDQRKLQSQGRELNEWGWAGDGGAAGVLADSDRIGCNEVVEPISCGEAGEETASTPEYSGVTGWWGRWSVEPDVGRVAYGVPNRVDRLKGLGNAVVPQIPEIIGRAIIAAHNA